MATIEAGPGLQHLHYNFGGAHLPIANTETGKSLGPFAVTGSIDETDSGIVTIAKTGGWARLTGTNEDGAGIAVGTQVCMSPVLNGPLSLEVRCELQVLTARTVFAGFVSANALDVAEPLTSTGTALTPVADSYAGFWLDSQLDAAAYWHMPHEGGVTAGEVLSTNVVADIAVAAATDILRVEVDPNGDVRWWLNGILKQTIKAAVSTTTLLAAFVGVFGTTSTITDIDANYLDVMFNNDWTV